MPVVMRELSDRGVVVEVIEPQKRAIDLSSVQVAHDIYVLKRTNGLALSIAGALHAQGAAIVNPYPATVALSDKIVTSRILQAAGIPTPVSYAVSRPQFLAPLLDEGPLVIKPYQGSEGYGVRVIRSAGDLAAMPAGKDPLLVQRYHAPDGRDRKIYSIGGRLFGVKKIFPARTPVEKRGEPFTPSSELRDIARRCGQAFGIDLFGVDIIESEGSPYVVDMCSMPGFKGVPDAPLHLASYFFACAAAQREGARAPLIQSRTAAATSPVEVR
jgi:ribosomal protein S6--L-glutamate ligase